MGARRAWVLTRPNEMKDEGRSRSPGDSGRSYGGRFPARASAIISVSDTRSAVSHRLLEREQTVSTQLGHLASVPGSSMGRSIVVPERSAENCLGSGVPARRCTRPPRRRGRPGRRRSTRELAGQDSDRRGWETLPTRTQRDPAGWMVTVHRSSVLHQRGRWRLGEGDGGAATAGSRSMREAKTEQLLEGSQVTSHGRGWHHEGS